MRKNSVFSLFIIRLQQKTINISLRSYQHPNVEKKSKTKWVAPASVTNKFLILKLGTIISFIEVKPLSIK